jgi:hypothetical protein
LRKLKECTGKAKDISIYTLHCPKNKKNISFSCGKLENVSSFDHKFKENKNIIRKISFKKYQKID